jgi:hypothetical protein
MGAARFRGDWERKSGSGSLRNAWRHEDTCRAVHCGNYSTMVAQECRPSFGAFGCGAQKLTGDMHDSEIAGFFVVLPEPAESPFAFLIERLVG